MKTDTELLKPARPYSSQVERVELLPFRVRLAETPQDIFRVVESRSAAYARHVPRIGEALRKPEVDDLRSDVLILIAESKLDRGVLGSLRLQSNFKRRLHIESEMPLPDAFNGRRLVEGRRLGVKNGTLGRMVMVALVKAAYELCHAAETDHVIVAGRRSVSEIYRSMLFDDLLEGGTVPLSYADSLSHSVFSMPIQDADRRWRTANHALYDFMARTDHPDIHVDYGRVFDAFAAG